MYRALAGSQDHRQWIRLGISVWAMAVESSGQRRRQCRAGGYQVGEATTVVEAEEEDT